MYQYYLGVAGQDKTLHAEIFDENCLTPVLREKSCQKGQKAN